jgi:hypothetical protein
MPTKSKHSNPKCKTCKYRAAEQDLHGCDYNLITGLSRGCSVRECNKYEKGKKIRYLRKDDEFGYE